MVSWSGVCFYCSFILGGMFHCKLMLLGYLGAINAQCFAPGYLVIYWNRLYRVISHKDMARRMSYRWTLFSPGLNQAAITTESCRQSFNRHVHISKCTIKSIMEYDMCSIVLWQAEYAITWLLLAEIICASRIRSLLFASTKAERWFGVCSRIKSQCLLNHCSDGSTVILWLCLKFKQ